MISKGKHDPGYFSALHKKDNRENYAIGHLMFVNRPFYLINVEFSRAFWAAVVGNFLPWQTFLISNVIL